MKKTLIALSLFAIIPVGAALADGDCFAPHDQWQPREAALQMAEQNGWTVRKFEVDDGCYELEGRDGNGRKFEVKLDPATLQIVDRDTEGDDDDDDMGGPAPAPAGTVAPPQNGLFESGSAPTVQVN
jgi:hypothetical protein